MCQIHIVIRSANDLPESFTCGMLTPQIFGLEAIKLWVQDEYLLHGCTLRSANENQLVETVGSGLELSAGVAVESYVVPVFGVVAEGEKIASYFSVANTRDQEDV